MTRAAADRRALRAVLEAMESGQVQSDILPLYSALCDRVFKPDPDRLAVVERELQEIKNRLASRSLKSQEPLRPSLA